VQCNTHRNTPICVASSRVAKPSRLLHAYEQVLSLKILINGSGTLATVFLAKTSATAKDILLALATLGDVTQIGSFLSLLLCPRWPGQLQLGHCCMSLSLVLSCYLRQCKHRLEVLCIHISAVITLGPYLQQFIFFIAYK